MGEVVGMEATLRSGVQVSKSSAETASSYTEVLPRVLGRGGLTAAMALKKIANSCTWLYIICSKSQTDFIASIHVDEQSWIGLNLQLARRVVDHTFRGFVF